MKRYAYGVALAVGLSAGSVWAGDEADSLLDALTSLGQETDQKNQTRSAVVPLIFNSENMGAGAGAAGVIHGLGETKASLVGIGLYSNNDSGMAALGLFNTGFSQESRWRFDILMVEGRFTDSDLYVSGNPVFAGAPRAGSNDSDVDNYVNTEQYVKDYRMRAKWLAPIGDGVNGYKRQGNQLGLSKNDDPNRPVWNPLASGRTVIETEYFYRTRDLEENIDPVEESRGDTTSGIKLTLDYDNRNGFSSPTAGSRTKIMVTRDWGAGDQTDYTKLELDYSQYFNLGTSEYFSQQVLAVNAYASDIVTWDDDNPDSIPAWFARSKMGGWNTLRGYSNNRYNGRSAINYSAEVRGITRTNWLGESFLGDYYSIPYTQVAAFVDAGRVADEWNWSELNSDMQSSVGVSLRFLFEGVNIRMDMARSDEGGQLWFFVNQPF